MKYKNDLHNYSWNYTNYYTNYSCNENKVFESVLQDYENYIYNIDKVKEIFSKIKTVKYFNVGMFKDDDNWEYNLHIFVINDKNFEYKTGVGIKIENTVYDRIKLLFDFIYTIIQETTYLNYSKDDFLESMGYMDDIKNYKKGLKIYSEIQTEGEKVIEIFGNDIVNNLYDYMEL